MEMQNDLVRVPVILVRLSTNEVYALAFATGVVAAVAYQVGKEAQRRWIERTVRKAIKDLKTAE